LQWIFTEALPGAHLLPRIRWSEVAARNLALAIGCVNERAAAFAESPAAALALVLEMSGCARRRLFEGIQMAKSWGSAL